MALARAAPGHRGISGGPPQPSGKELCLAQAADLLEGFAKYILDEVFDFVAMLQVAADLAIHEWLVALGELSKGNGITRTRLFYQYRVLWGHTRLFLPVWAF